MPALPVHTPNWAAKFWTSVNSSRFQSTPTTSCLPSWVPFPLPSPVFFSSLSHVPVASNNSTYLSKVHIKSLCTRKTSLIPPIPTPGRWKPFFALPHDSANTHYIRALITLYCLSVCLCYPIQKKKFFRNRTSCIAVNTAPKQCLAHSRTTDREWVNESLTTSPIGLGQVINKIFGRIGLLLFYLPRDLY